MAFLGFFLFIGAWSLATPYDGTPDEKEHTVRAAGVAAGEVAPPPAEAIRGGGAFQHVPESLVRENCWRRDISQPAGCAAEPGGNETIVRAPTGAGRYHPVYYAAVGWPLVISPDWTGLLLARLVSAGLCAALLANALVDAMRWSRYRVMAVGILAAVTPMAAHMGGAINPNGLEIAAGVAFFAAAVPLLYAPGGLRSRSLLWHTGVAALALVSLRAAGPIWLAVSALALLVPLRWELLRQLWQRRGVRWWTLGIVSTTAACAVWTVAFKTTFMGDFTGGRRWALGQAIRYMMERWGGWLNQMVGVMSWLETRLPAPVYMIWQFLAAGLILWGFVLAGRAGRWRLAMLAAGGVAVPSLMQLSHVNKYGFITQGRYLLPVLVGLPLLAAFLIGQAGLSRDRSRFLVRLFAVALLPLHLLALVWTMVRYQQGLDPDGGFRALNPLVGDWQPPLGSVVPLVASVAGLLVIGWFVWSATAWFPAASPVIDRDPTAAKETDPGAATQAVPRAGEAPPAGHGHPEPDGETVPVTRSHDPAPASPAG